MRVVAIAASRRRSPLRYVITDSADLAYLGKNWHLLPSTPDSRVILDFRNMPAVERQIWEARLSALYFDCGCRMGAICALLAVGLFMLCNSLGVWKLGWFSWQLVVWSLASFFIGGLIGKVGGLTVSGYRWRKATARLHERLISLDNERCPIPRMLNSDKPSPFK